MSRIDKSFVEAQPFYYQLRRDMGGHNPRPCIATTLKGTPCQASALTFIHRSVCRQHATNVEIERNREKMQLFRGRVNRLLRESQKTEKNIL